MAEDLFGAIPRRKRRVMMHVIDAGFEAGNHIAVFGCETCGHQSEWMIVSGITKGKRGLPCPVCNQEKQDTMKRTASISKCGKFRTRLERVWDETKPRICWIMLNPSVANGERDDPTMLRVIHFSQAWGYGSLVVVNLYPYITADPKKMKQWAEWDKQGTPDWHARDAIQQNLNECIIPAAAAASKIMVAWGNNVIDPNWPEYVLEEIFSATNHVEVQCLGKTKFGNPIHPMARGKHRVPDTQKPVSYLALTTAT